MQDLDAIEAQPGSVFDHIFDRVLRGVEVPVGISGDSELDAALRFGLSGDVRWSGSQGSGAGAEQASARQ